MQPPDRIVLITGAGFSALAGIPVQAGVLNAILQFEPKVGYIGRSDFTRARDRVQGFLNAVFLQRGQTTEVQPDDLPRIGRLSLEDLYTVIDKAIARRDWLLYHDWQALVEVRRSLDHCVLQYLTDRQATYTGSDYDLLVKRLTSKFGGQWATLSLNWDTLWDKALIRSLAQEGHVPDYGCSPPWLRQYDNTYEVAQYSRDKLGVKHLKLHGSFNWLTCPRCRTLFVSEVDVGKQGFLDPFECPYCLPGRSGPHKPSLQPLFLTPTILKTFDNPSLNIVWDEAIHTLANATHIIFVGYSFPLADHDIRYLLRKAVSARAKVSVVLYQDDRPDDVPPRFRDLLPEARYKAFFGIGDEAFNYDGWQAYFDSFFANAG